VYVVCVRTICLVCERALCSTGTSCARSGGRYPCFIHAALNCMHSRRHTIIITRMYVCTNIHKHTHTLCLSIMELSSLIWYMYTTYPPSRIRTRYLCLPITLMETVCTHTNTHTHTHTYIHTHIYIHTKREFTRTHT